MGTVCGCGRSGRSPLQELHCFTCGAPCCQSCAVALESATYCGRCAESILDGEGVPLSPSAPAARIWPNAVKAKAKNGCEKARWVILVARNQADLYSHLVRAFSRDDKVEIVMDRRKDYRRNPPGMEDRLRSHGAAVIKRCFT